VSFAGTTMQNRVWAIDGLVPLDKWRISSIKTELGATVSVNYSGQECVPGDRAAIFANPQNNTKRCYSQWWSPAVTPPQAVQQDLFHKYVVTSVIDNPNTVVRGLPRLRSPTCMARRRGGTTTPRCLRRTSAPGRFSLGSIPPRCGSGVRGIRRGRL
jgi:hypothetical protein